MYDGYDLAFPGRIAQISGDFAKVDLGGVTIEKVNISLIEAKVGDIVLVHRGYAIQVLDEDEGMRMLQRWKET